MLDWLSLIGLGAFLVTSAWAGTRLLWLFLRTRREAEAMVGLALLLYGCLGYGLVVVGRQLGPEPGNLATWLVLAGLVCENAGAAAIYRLTFLFFGTGRRGSRWIFLAAIALLVTGGAGDLFYRVWGHLDGRGTPAYWAVTFARLGGFVWLAVESLAHFRRMQRRLALGLARPYAAHRFLLWGVGSLCGVLGVAIWVGFQAWTGLTPAGVPAVQAAVSLLALAAALCNVLVFFPPRRYQRWIESQTPPRTGGPGRPVRVEEPRP